MLSVVRELAEEAERRAGEPEPLGELLVELVRHGEDAVARTPEQLDVLREAGVVDAGGAGLVELLRGVAAAVSGEPVPEAPEVAAERAGLDAIHLEPSRYRYCTVFVVEGDALDRDALEAQLEQLGDSLLVVGDETALKVHVHTDDPGAALRLGTAAGTIEGIEIANMQEQQEQRDRRLSLVPSTRARERRRRGRRRGGEPQPVRDARRAGRADPDRRGRTDREPVDRRAPRRDRGARRRRGDPPAEQLERPARCGAGGAARRPAGRDRRDRLDSRRPRRARRLRRLAQRRRERGGDARSGRRRRDGRGDARLARRPRSTASRSETASGSASRTATRSPAETTSPMSRSPSSSASSASRARS